MESPWWRIGWRNLGRNRRRTLITALGLGVGYFAVVFIVGWADGLTAEDVLDFCRDKIAHYKVPRYVEFLEEFPLTVTGKVQKFRLRDMGIEKFGLEEVAGTETA